MAAGASCGGFALLFSIMTAASAAAFFCASRAGRVLSATVLPASTRYGFFAGRVVGVGEVSYCVVSAAGVSGCFCCSVDIKSAFSINPIRPADLNLLGIYWRGG